MEFWKNPSKNWNEKIEKVSSLKRKTKLLRQIDPHKTSMVKQKEDYRVMSLQMKKPRETQNSPFNQHLKICGLVLYFFKTRWWFKKKIWARNWRRFYEEKTIKRKRVGGRGGGIYIKGTNLRGNGSRKIWKHGEQEKGAQTRKVIEFDQTSHYLTNIQII